MLCQLSYASTIPPKLAIAVNQVGTHAIILMRFKKYITIWVPVSGEQPAQLQKEKDRPPSIDRDACAKYSTLPSLLTKGM
jgi:hypothetical protein